MRLFASQEAYTAGNTWRPPTALSPATRALGLPVLAVSPNGKTLLAYALNGAILLRTLPAGSAATRWSAPTKLSGSRTGCTNPRITFAPSGRALVGFICANRVLVTEQR